FLLFLPNRNVLGALARERLPLPTAPALAQRHAREPRHQVKLRRPHIAKRRRDGVDLAVLDPVVMRDESLTDNVVLVKADVPRLDDERLERFTRREPLQPGNEKPDDKAAAWPEIPR